MNSINPLFLVAAGGACGACCRYLTGIWLSSPESRFPLATLVVNVSGAFIAGLIVSVLLQRGLSASPFYALVVVGFLGSFTTMSAFSVESLRLLESGQYALAFINIALTLLACLGAVFAGATAARAFA